MSSFKIRFLISAFLAAFIFISIIHISAIANPQSVSTLNYKANEGDILKYESFRQDSRISEREGETSEFTTKRTYDFHLQAEKTDSLLSFVLTVDKLGISTEGGRDRGFASGIEPQAIQGKKLRVKITPQGDQRQITAIDSIPMPEPPDRRGDRPFRGRLGNPLNQLRINFFQLPAKAMKVGDSWTEPYKDTDQMGGFFGRFAQDQKVEGKTKHTILDEEKKNGLTCLHIKIESTYYMAYTAVSGEGHGVGLASTKDFIHVRGHGMIFPPLNKDLCIFPEKIHNKYIALHRPLGDTFGKPSIWYFESPDLLHWGNHSCLMRAGDNEWEQEKIGAGPQPFKTPDGWLLLYHGCGHESIYSLFLCLLDLNDPRKILKRGNFPILTPEDDWEKNGFFPNVVFSNGWVLMPDGTVKIYYGAADNCICLAETTLDDLLSSFTYHSQVYLLPVQ